MKIVKIYKDLIVYFLLTAGSSWLIFFPAVLESKGLLITSVSNDLLVKIGTFAPTVFALLLTYFKYGKEGVKNLLKRVLQYRFDKVWYLYIFLLMPGILILSFLFMNVFAGEKFNSLLIPIIIQQPWLIVPIFLYMLVLQGPFGEEFGWRGFVLDRFLQLWNPLISSIILGTIWTLWHLPNFFIRGTIQYEIASDDFIITFTGYLLYTVMLTVLFTILYLKTNGSILAAMLFHTMSNLSHGLVTILTTLTGGLIVLIVMFFVTLMIVVVNKKVIYSYDNRPNLSD